MPLLPVMDGARKEYNDDSGHGHSPGNLKDCQHAYSHLMILLGQAAAVREDRNKVRYDLRALDVQQ